MTKPSAKEQIRIPTAKELAAAWLKVTAFGAPELMREPDWVEDKMADAIHYATRAAASGRRPLVYMAHPVAPTAEQLETWTQGSLDGVSPPSPGWVIQRNLIGARRWLRWFSINVPQWVVIAPWIAAVESVMEAGAEEREERAREMIVCREVAGRCDAVVQVGGRVSSGMAEEGAAARTVVDLTWAGQEPPGDVEASATLALGCVLRGREGA